MRTHIAAFVATAAGIAATVVLPGSAFATASSGAISASPTVCAAETVAGKPCVWQERSSAGVSGLTELTVTDARPVLVRVELKTQRAWGSPWLTAASTTSVQQGSIRLATPKVVTNERSIVCATTAPVADLTQQVTTCTAPY
ncbi:hypothetical protein CFP65_7510 [Kitasatospora sp. MMS16-BH015]|uniref:hypothetical protein n=1 Tax=Kitasatospora sp. MMS16-BH015 TaxID=2018025 RepID=UPI000CA3C6EF|nr:hypothetical protein [Kitasatospora sp. MMS16-BH015]AUG82087.1 hypothetical protein CFP65_7510 [Kitasatospora sp. MMS16-BH015]